MREIERIKNSRPSLMSINARPIKIKVICVCVCKNVRVKININKD